LVKFLHQPNCHIHSQFAWERDFGDRSAFELHQNSGGGIWFAMAPEGLRLDAKLVAAELAFVIGTCARRMVVWRVSCIAQAGFVLDALEQALRPVQPAVATTD